MIRVLVCGGRNSDDRPALYAAMDLVTCGTWSRRDAQHLGGGEMQRLAGQASRIGRPSRLVRYLRNDLMVEVSA